jgi:hypothetical protein
MRANGHFVSRTKSRTLTASLLILVLVASSGCSAVLGERGSGDVTTETREVDEFTGIALEGEGRVEIEVGDSTSLTIEAEDNLLPLLTSEVSGGVLVLGTTREVDPTEEIVYHVISTGVERLQVSGSGQIDSPVVGGEAVAIGVSGSGEVRVDDATANDIQVDISGSGFVEISGEADTLEVTISGSGSLDAEALTVMTADVTIPGSGDVVVDVVDHLEVDVSGSGTVEYLGSPEVDSNISGSGSVDQR